MYKIAIIDKNNHRLFKKKLYESKCEFEKWKKLHTENYVKLGICYLVCYKLNSKGKWIKI